MNLIARSDSPSRRASTSATAPHAAPAAGSDAASLASSHRSVEDVYDAACDNTQLLGRIPFTAGQHAIEGLGLEAKSRLLARLTLHIEPGTQLKFESGAIETVPLPALQRRDSLTSQASDSAADAQGKGQDASLHSRQPRVRAWRRLWVVLVTWLGTLWSGRPAAAQTDLPTPALSGRPAPAERRGPRVPSLDARLNKPLVIGRPWIPRGVLCVRVIGASVDAEGRITPLGGVRILGGIIRWSLKGYTSTLPRLNTEVALLVSGDLVQQHGGGAEPGFHRALTRFIAAVTEPVKWRLRPLGGSPRRVLETPALSAVMDPPAEEARGQLGLDPRGNLTVEARGAREGIIQLPGLGDVEVRGRAEADLRVQTQGLKAGQLRGQVEVGVDARRPGEPGWREVLRVPTHLETSGNSVELRAERTAFASTAFQDALNGVTAQARFGRVDGAVEEVDIDLSSVRVKWQDMTHQITADGKLKVTRDVYDAPSAKAAAAAPALERLPAPGIEALLCESAFEGTRLTGEVRFKEGAHNIEGVGLERERRLLGSLVANVQPETVLTFACDRISSEGRPTPASATTDLAPDATPEAKSWASWAWSWVRPSVTVPPPVASVMSPPSAAPAVDSGTAPVRIQGFRATLSRPIEITHGWLPRAAVSARLDGVRVDDAGHITVEGELYRGRSVLPLATQVALPAINTEVTKLLRGEFFQHRGEGAPTQEVAALCEILERMLSPIQWKLRPLQANAPAAGDPSAWRPLSLTTSPTPVTYLAAPTRDESSGTFQVTRDRKIKLTLHDTRYGRVQIPTLSLDRDVRAVTDITDAEIAIPAEKETRGFRAVPTVTMSTRPQDGAAWVQELEQTATLESRAEGGAPPALQLALNRPLFASPFLQSLLGQVNGEMRWSLRDGVLASASFNVAGITASVGGYRHTLNSRGHYIIKPDRATAAVGMDPKRQR
jgi:hypothetical protein